MNQLSKRTIQWATLTTAILTSAIGCETPVKPAPAPMPQTFTMPASRAAATAALVPLVAKFNDDISNFPGTSGAEHRQTLVIALDDITKILRLINGPAESPGLTNSLTIISASEQTAKIQSIPRPRMEAVENQALQAINTAVKDLATRYLLDRDQLPGLLDALDSKVTNAATVQGPMHDVDATDSFQATAAVIQRMTDDLKAMMPDGTSPVVTMPAAPVTPMPVSPMPMAPVPAMPATVPTTMP